MVALDCYRCGHGPRIWRVTTPRGLVVGICEDCQHELARRHFAEGQRREAEAFAARQLQLFDGGKR